MHRIKISVLAAVGLAAASSPANAANYTLSLTGDPSLLAPGTFVGGTKAALVLAGLDGTSPLSVSQGDSVNVTVTLSSLLTISPISGLTAVDDLFSGTGFDGSPVNTTDVFSFYNGGTLVATYSGGDGTSLQLASGISYAPGTTLTFDSYTDNFTINTLTGTASLNGARFTYDRFFAAPEPATWMLTIAGMGLVGGAMRRKRAAVRLA